MAKSDIAQALDRLQGFAEDMIFKETARRTQLGLDKQERQIAAYNYLIAEEDSLIKENQAAYDQIKTSLLETGTEMKSVKPEHQTVDSESLLTAAGESSLAMVQLMLESKKQQKESWENTRRESEALKRYLDVYDKAITLVDPAATGDPELMEASDVADATEKFLVEYGALYGPEIAQRTLAYQQPDALRSLQSDFYTRQMADVKAETDAMTVKTAASRTQQELLKPQIVELKEAAMSKLYQGGKIIKMSDIVGSVAGLQAELDALDIGSTDYTEKQKEVTMQLETIGIQLFPWLGVDKVEDKAAGFLKAVRLAVKDGNFVGLVGFLNLASMKYEGMNQGDAAVYKKRVQDLTGIDISDTNWIADFSMVSDRIYDIDIEEGDLALEISQAINPDWIPEEEQPTDFDIFMSSKLNIGDSVPSEVITPTLPVPGMDMYDDILYPFIGEDDE